MRLSALHFARSFVLVVVCRVVPEMARVLLPRGPSTEPEMKTNRSSVLGDALARRRSTLRSRTGSITPITRDIGLVRPRPAERRSAEYVADIASTDLVTVACRTSAAEALRVAETRGVRHLLVVKDTELLGVLCTCDLATREPAAAVADWMSRPPITISSSAPIDLAAVLMRWHAIACLPVLRHGRLSGILTRRDLRSVGHEILEPPCQRCGDDHHVREDSKTGSPVCVRCLQAG